MSSEPTNEGYRDAVLSDRAMISVRNLSKYYKLYDDRKHRLFESLDIFRKKKYHRKFYALRDISFDVGRGQTTGIIGENGSGKSTLLSIVSGISQPSAGEVTVNGRVASLLELGAGFNPEMTGVENILFSGITLGFTEEWMLAKTEEILRFADIGEYAHQPVKSYSSGMFVRLAFAVNLCVEPDILIVDEALSVGDMAFQAKCVTAIQKIREMGTTILFVAHDLGMMKSLCDKVIYLRKGVMVDMGPADIVTKRYLLDVYEKAGRENARNIRVSQEFGGDTPVVPEVTMGSIPPEAFMRSEAFDRHVAAFRYKTGEAQITYMEVTDLQGMPLVVAAHDQEVLFRIHLESQTEQEAVVSIVILDRYKNMLTNANFQFKDAKPIAMSKGGRYLVTYRMRLPLGEGMYSCNAEIWRSSEVTGLKVDRIDSVMDAVIFQVRCDAGKMIGTKFHLDYSLHVQKVEDPVDRLLGGAPRERIEVRFNP